LSGERSWGLVYVFASFGILVLLERLNATGAMPLSKPNSIGV
jgi:hypothetical protein